MSQVRHDSVEQKDVLFECSRPCALLSVCKVVHAIHDCSRNIGIGVRPDSLPECESLTRARLPLLALNLANDPLCNYPLRILPLSHIHC